MNVKGTELVGMDVIDPNKCMLVVTEKGFGKRTPEESYRCQGRGGQGVLNIKVTERNGKVIGFRQVGEDNGIMLITDTGRLIRMPVSQISIIGRVMGLDEGERVVDLTVIDAEEARDDPGEEE
jgi:DNA gyrase subunit A